MATLLQNIYEDAIVRIQLDRELSLLKLTFLNQPDTDQFRNGYHLAIDTAKRKDIQFWLTDARQIKTMLPENQAWLAQNMAPLLKIGKLQKFAIMLSPECFVMTNPNQTYSKAVPEKESASGGVIKIHFDEESARNWLLSGVMAG